MEMNCEIQTIGRVPRERISSDNNSLFITLRGEKNGTSMVISCIFMTKHTYTALSLRLFPVDAQALNQQGMRYSRHGNLFFDHNSVVQMKRISVSTKTHPRNDGEKGQAAQTIGNLYLTCSRSAISSFAVKTEITCLYTVQQRHKNRPGYQYKHTRFVIFILLILFKKQNEGGSLIG